MPKRDVTMPDTWPKCGEADGCASYCGQLGDGYGKRCRWHGGIKPPPGDWYIQYGSNAIYLVNGQESHQVSWWAAVRMIEKGHVKRGIFLRNKGKRLRDKLASDGVSIKTLNPHRFAPEYAFEVSG